MELLGSYWLRRALARLASLTVYEGQDTRTGMPVMVLVGAKGEPVEAEGSLKVLDRLEAPRGRRPIDLRRRVGRLHVWGRGKLTAAHRRTDRRCHEERA